MEKRLINKSIELILLFLLFSLIFHSKIFYDSYQLPKIFGVFIALLAGILLILLNQSQIKFTAVLMFFLIYILYIFSSTYISSNTPSVFYSLTLLAPVCFIFTTYSPINTKKFSFFILLLVSLSLLNGFIQVLINPNKPFSFFGNPIFFGEFSGATLPLIIYFYLFNKKYEFLSLFLIISTLFSLLLIGSKGVMISVFISLLFFIIKTKNFISFRLKENSIIILFIFLLYSILIIFIPHFNKLLFKNSKSIISSSFTTSVSVKNRIIMANSAIDMIKEKPLFGHGAGGVRYFYQKYQSKLLNQNPYLSFIKTSYLHNDYLQIMTEFGIFGLVIFLLFIFYLLYVFDKNSNLLNINEYIFSISLISGIIFILCESFFNFPMFILPSSVLFFVFSGMVYSANVKNIPDSKKNALFTFILLLSSLFFVSFALIKNTPSIVSNLYCGKALHEGKNNSPMEGVYYLKALEINKKDYTASFNLGMHYFYKDDKKNAIKYFERAILIYPYSADAIYNIATINKSIGKKKIAEEYFKKTLELYPNSVLANLNLGKLYLDMNKMEEGLKYIAKSKELAPDYYDTEQLNKIIEFRETTYELKGVHKKF